MSTFDYILLGLIAGLATGSAGGYYFYRRLRINLTEVDAISENIHALATLMKLQAGDTAAAIKMNETKLDVSIIALGERQYRLPKECRNPNVLFYLRRAKEYREQHPHKSDNVGFDWYVAQYLALAE